MGEDLLYSCLSPMLLLAKFNCLRSSEYWQNVDNLKKKSTDNHQSLIKKIFEISGKTNVSKHTNSSSEN